MAAVANGIHAHGTRAAELRRAVACRHSWSGWPISRPSARTGTSAACFFVALSICAAILNSTTPSTLYAVYQARWQLGATTLAAIFAIYSVATLAALLVLGRLSDRRLVIVPALLVCAAGCVPPSWPRSRSRRARRLGPSSALPPCSSAGGPPGCPSPCWLACRSSPR
ncbi:hypothetical protein [Geminicoccus harenae]|uniref:hypothetical protein n=1 Tax=Geminicoccus harenae TaxID=2498453 RepID=UPI002AC35BB4|nr:hypothetical protein [Geminicoccus harenae]